MSDIGGDVKPANALLARRRHKLAGHLPEQHAVPAIRNHIDGDLLAFRIRAVKAAEVAGGCPPFPVYHLRPATYRP